MDLLQTAPVAVVFAFGLITGSFANVCIHRLPLDESVVWPASRCPHCRTEIRAWDNIPVLSWLFLRGRCRSCRAPISARYPLVELANAGAWAAYVGWSGLDPRGVVHLGLITALLVLALVDWDHQILPDVITLPGIVVGVAASFLGGAPAPLEAVLSAAGGLLAFAAVAKSYEWLRGVEGLGQGDWKMTAMLGAFFGWQKLLLSVFLGSLTALVFGVTLMVTQGRTTKHKVPLGTFLALGALLALFFGDGLIAWYRGVAGL